MNVPHDHAAERALLSAMLLSADAAAKAERLVDAGDFHRPAYGLMFDGIRTLRSNGVRPDSTVLLDKLGDTVAADVVLDVAAFPASTQSVERYAEIVAEHAVRRRLIAAGQELAEAARAGDPYAVLDAHCERIETMDLPVTRTNGLMLLDEMLDRPEATRAQWVVPGLLREDWRCVVVAGEGAGKSLMLQQVAICASQGVHPFWSSSRIPPVTTLLVDTENPDGRIQEGCSPIRDVTSRVTGQWEPRTWLWHRPGGLDLRSRRDKAAFEAVLHEVRPRLVCAGPSYKLAERGAREGWDEVARAVQTVLDSLRTRFKFALLLEDHAPQAANGSRDLRPFGSSMWLRWPELGLKLVRDGDRGDVRVDHWRAARMAHSWPDELHRGGSHSLPWVGYWRDGTEF